MVNKNIIHEYAFMQTQKKDHYTCHLVEGSSSLSGSPQDKFHDVPNIPHLGDTYVFDTGKAQKSPAIVKGDVIITKNVCDAYAEFIGGYMLIENSFIESLAFSVEATIQVDSIGQDDVLLPIVYSKNDAGNSLYIYISKTTEGTALVTKLGSEAGDSIHGVNTNYDSNNFVDFSSYVGTGTKTHILISIGIMNNNMSVKYTLNGIEVYTKVASVSQNYVNYKLATESYIGRGELESDRFNGKIYHVTIWDTVDSSFISSLYDDRTNRKFKPVTELLTLYTKSPYKNYISGHGSYSQIHNETYVRLHDDGSFSMQPRRIGIRNFDYSFIVKMHATHSQSAESLLTAMDFVHPVTYSRSKIDMDFSSTETQSTNNLNEGEVIDLVIYTLDSNFNETNESKKFVITHLKDIQFGREEFAKYSNGSWATTPTDNMELSFKFDNNLSNVTTMWAAINDTFLDDNWHNDKYNTPAIENKYWGFGIQLHTQHLTGFRSISAMTKFRHYDSTPNDTEELITYWNGENRLPNQDYHSCNVRQSDNQSYDYNWPIDSNGDFAGTGLIRGLSHSKDRIMFRSPMNENNFRIALLYDWTDSYSLPFMTHSTYSGPNYKNDSYVIDSIIYLDCAAENVSHILWKANGKSYLTSNIIKTFSLAEAHDLITVNTNEFRFMVDHIFNDSNLYKNNTNDDLRMQDGSYDANGNPEGIDNVIANKCYNQPLTAVFFDGPMISARYPFKEYMLNTIAIDSRIDTRYYSAAGAGGTNSSYSFNNKYSFSRSDAYEYVRNRDIRWYKTSSGLRYYNVAIVCDHDTDYNNRNTSSLDFNWDNDLIEGTGYPGSYLHLKQGKTLLLNASDASQNHECGSIPYSVEIWMKLKKGDIIWYGLSQDAYATISNQDTRHDERTLMYLCKSNTGMLKFGYCLNFSSGSSPNLPFPGSWISAEHPERSATSDVNLNSEEVINNINQYVISYRTATAQFSRISKELIFNIYFNGKRVIKDFRVSSNLSKNETEFLSYIGKQRSSSDAVTEAHIYDIRSICGYYTEENVKNSHYQGYDQGLAGYVPVSVQLKSEAVNGNTATGLDRKYKIELTGELDYSDVYYYNGSDYLNPGADTILPGNTTIYIRSSDGSSPSGQVNLVAVEYEVDSTELSKFYEKGFHSYYTPDHNVTIESEHIEDVYLYSDSDMKYTPIAKSNIYNNEFSLTSNTSYWLSLNEGEVLNFRAA